MKRCPAFRSNFFSNAFFCWQKKRASVGRFFFTTKNRHFSKKISTATCLPAGRSGLGQHYFHGNFNVNGNFNNNNNNNNNFNNNNIFNNDNKNNYIFNNNNNNNFNNNFNFNLWKSIKPIVKKLICENLCNLWFKKFKNLRKSVKSVQSAFQKNQNPICDNLCILWFKN